MKRLLLLAFLLLPSAASAQCNGVFANNTACGNISGSSNLPKPIPLTSFPANAPGGSSGQIQYNAGGGLFGGFTMGGFCTVATATGILSCPTAVVGPASATDNSAVRFDATTGKLVKDSPLSIANITAALSRVGGGGVALQALTAGTAIAAGDVGELLTAEVTYASRISMTSATIIAVTSKTITPGVWDCSGNHGFETTGGGVASEYYLEISTSAPPTVVTAPNNGCTQGTHNTYTANQGQVFPNGPCQILVTTPTSVYLKSLSTFTNNQTAYGFLRCRRH